MDLRLRDRHTFVQKELALAHVNTDGVEAAYRRTDLFDRHRRLMADWAAYVA